MTVLRFAIALGALVATGAAAQADPTKPPTVEYTATETLTQEGQPPAVRKVSYSKSRLRTEYTAGRGTWVLIVDGPGKRVISINVTNRTYEQWEHDGTDPGAPMAGQTVKIEKQADEAVGGVPATKNKISGKSPDGKDFEAMVWSSAQNIHLKMSGTDMVDGKPVAIGMEMSNVKIGPVDAKLFAVPAGYRNVTPPPDKSAPPKK